MSKKKLYGFAISCLILFTTCKKESSITQNPNKFGTLFGSGGFLDLKGAVLTDDNHYLLYGTIENKINGDLDGFVMKVDENFNIIWNKTFGGSKDDYFKSLTIDENSNIMVVGSSNSFGPSIDANYGYSNSLFYIVYLDKKGNKLWEKAIQANESAGNINRHNSADKVLYLKNKTFAIAGSTENYKNTVGGITNYSRDVYAFGIDTKANIIWRKLFYDTMQTSENNYNENCYDAALCDDGNIMLLMTHYIFPETNLSLIKTGYNDTGFSVNNYFWKGPPAIEFTHLFSYSEDNYHPPMELLKGDKVIYYDDANGGIVITDDKGKLSKYVKFREEFYSGIITKHLNHVIIGGYYNLASKFSFCWVIVDLEGNIIKEAYEPPPGLKINEVFSMKDIFLTPNNEIAIFGIINNVNGTSIIMLKYNTEGNLISK